VGKIGGFLFLRRRQHPTGGEAEPNPFWYSRGTWKTSNLPKRESYSQEEPMRLLAQDDGKSESYAVIAWIKGETHSYAKAGRLPSGFSTRKRFKNHLRRKSK
jgi:hypothetical protein